ncbi:EVE domain-containing protein [Pseudoalteromonas tunicata]|uniref:EVE domain-containing protein n=1 Tax=Pseudoalteromonas tunicata D2 TaxID=87626 RepID=A4CF59_9GAMM|nr:EVE domain-containing protein [Pseudoalteromonas tunicata]ATC96234.1 hypothetical protein PTUN_a3993 [Pseudoalteromonas tunicata]AXT31748.1 EVE domain-containing protein [Pseudoalteromonas tunicata]EAR26607.1 hypothetical protein PTD2_00322 [Pseudoalteromonas tunicata D2]
MAYWLFKTEPDVFSITDLAEKNTADWEGVRNYQARNFLRDGVALGDLVFIYHSSCKQPAIVGIAAISKSAHIDPSQFDPSSEYFDKKSSSDSPRWLQVSVEFVEQFKQPITLTKLKADLNLTDFILTQKGCRLSVMPVTPEQWHYITNMCQT